VLNFDFKSQSGYYLLSLYKSPAARLDAEQMALKKESKNLERALNQSFTWRVETLESDT
jgi:hypothetical protein